MSWLRFRRHGATLQPENLSGQLFTQQACRCLPSAESRHIVRRMNSRILGRSLEQIQRDLGIK
jgi:hypothetical protein